MSDISISFAVPGQPKGKGRARAYRRGNHIAHYTPEATASYENLVRVLAMRAMAGRPPLDVPVEVSVFMIFAVPASWSKRKRMAALAGEIRPTKKPDADNVYKAVTDGCNGVVYTDDALIISGFFRKIYGTVPEAMVSVLTA